MIRKRKRKKITLFWKVCFEIEKENGKDRWFSLEFFFVVVVVVVVWNEITWKVSQWIKFNNNKEKKDAKKENFN